MAKLADLRKKAKSLGIAPSVIRGATSAQELQDAISEFSGNGSVSKKSGKKAVKKASAVKKSSVVKKSKASKKASKPAATKATTKKKAKTSKGTNGEISGRHLLDGVDYSDSDGWNPRDGSAPDLIIKSLRKNKGNRSKVFEALKPDVWEFVGKKLADGSKRPLKDGPNSAHAMLKYRISRTAWDFAIRTGQHESSENRAEYGTAGTGSGNFKKGGKTKATKAKSSKTEKATGKKKSGKSKTTKAKVAPAKTKKASGAKRGRPKSDPKAAGKKAAAKKKKK